MNCLKIVILVLFVEFFRTLTMNSLNCEVFLIFLIPTIIAVRSQRHYAEKSPECGISCDKSPCQSPFAWCANDTVCGKVCISNGHVCNEPEEIENGGIKGTNRLYGAKITYYCEDDYELIGSKDRTCVGDKEWSGKPPYCVRKGLRCDKPPDVVENGYADIADGKEEFYVGDTVAYKCHIGFFPIISINNVTFCNLNSDGSLSWTPKINLKCQEKKCDSPDNITNGLYSGNPPYNVGTRILYHCNNGYTLEGSSTRTCTDNQQWSETTPVCAAPVSYPSNIRIILASENSAKVTWTPPPNFDEKNDRYILYLNATNGPKHPVPFNLPRDVNEYEITGLHKNDEYVFWMVTTRNGKETQITKPVHYIHVVNRDNIPAEVVAFDDTVRANLKGSVSLKCSVVGKPTPSITWFKDDKPIEENSRIYIWDKRILFINDLRKEDEGEYICRAKNAHGEGEVVYELIFQEYNTITTPSDVTPTSIVLYTVPEISSTTECDPFYTDCLQLLSENAAYDNCQFKKNAHVRAVMDGQQIIDESIEVPDQSVLKLRCNNISVFIFEGDNILQCNKTKWNGTIPTCSRLSPRKRDSIPMINYEITNGKDNVDDDGTLNVTEGATLKLSCLYFQTYLKYNIKWISADKTKINNAAWNSRENAYELILSPISRIHESKYSCCVDQHLCNSIRIRVTEYQCEDPPRPRNGFIRGDVSKTLGSEIEYGCDINYVPEGEQISKCILEHERLKWSHPPPQCKDPPKIEIRPKDQTVLSGGIVSFFCTATGDPKPQIEWRKNGKRVSNVRYMVIEMPRGSVLRIEPVHVGRDEAKYECVAENGAGDAVSAEASLTVRDDKNLPRGFPRIKTHPQPKVVEKGRNAVLLCQASGNPLPTITWLKDMIPVDMTNPRYSILEEGSLQIIESQKEDQGKYECVAENDDGTVHSYMGALHVRVRRVPPHFSIPPEKSYEVMPGSNLNITCVAVGFPIPHVKWRKGAIELTPEDQMPIGKNVLLLENIQESANYTCVAYSSLGDLEVLTQVIVKDTCEVDVHELRRRGLRVVLNSKQRTYVEGDKIQLECSSNNHRTNQHIMICKSGHEWDYGTHMPC